MGLEKIGAAQTLLSAGIVAAGISIPTVSKAPTEPVEQSIEARAAIATTLRRAKFPLLDAKKSSQESPQFPPEAHPFTISKIVDLALTGNINAAILLVDIVSNKIEPLGAQDEILSFVIIEANILAELEITDREYQIFQNAVQIHHALQIIHHPEEFLHILTEKDDQPLLSVTAKAFNEILFALMLQIPHDPFDPLLLDLLGMDEGELKELVEEVFNYQGFYTESDTQMISIKNIFGLK